MTMSSPVTTTPNFEPEGNPAPASRPDEQPTEDTPLTNAELVQLRIRVIALENLVIALLAEAPDRQLTLARDMATYISPRAGFTPHPITLRAADEMLSLVDRADRYLCPSLPQLPPRTASTSAATTRTRRREAPNAGD
jgi:hypothetical protein